ncbi:MAG: S-layer homology domain-containing protein [Monoglobales bacterium]
MKKILIICILILTNFMFLSMTSNAAPELPQITSFKDVLGVDSIDDIKYATIEYSDASGSMCADIARNDIEAFLQVYWDFQYERTIAPFTDNTVRDSYYINLWIDEKEVANSKHTIFITDMIYGAYGKGENGINNYIWYKPVTGNSRNALIRAAEDLKNKYQSQTRVPNEYDGYENIGDKTDCLNLEGCSTWAKNIIRQAAAENLLPYELSSGYKNDISRQSFCRLAAQMMAVKYNVNMDSRRLSTVIASIIADRQLQNEFDSVSYSDMEYVPDDIKLLTATGIITGYDTGEFMPEENITREEAAVIINRIFDYYNVATTADDSLYSDDSEISEWSRQSVYNMLGMSIMHGMGDGSFSPKSGFTAEQAITTFLRVYKNI